MSDKALESWEQAVAWLVSQPDQQALVAACYFDAPLAAAAARFWQSDEWRTVRSWLPLTRGLALDVGAGNGIASYALARDGWAVTALEPDRSDTVGVGAIRALAATAGLPITVVQEWGERLPFPDSSFALVYARQVLHHAHDLPTFCRELARVLKPGGLLVTTRDHVISAPRDLPRFLARHPLHARYGGEHAFTRRAYIAALRGAGLEIERVMGAFDSVVNYAPLSRAELRNELAARLARLPGGRQVAAVLLSPSWFDLTLRALSRLDRRPGRLISFIAHRPAHAKES